MKKLFSFFLLVSVSTMTVFSSSVDLPEIHTAIKNTHKAFQYFEKLESDIRFYDTKSTCEYLRNRHGQPEACFGLMGFLFKLNTLLKNENLKNDYEKWKRLAVDAIPLQYQFCKWMGKLSDEGKCEILCLYLKKNIGKEKPVNIVTFLDSVKEHSDLSWVYTSEKDRKEAGDSFKKTIDEFKVWVLKALNL